MNKAISIKLSDISYNEKCGLASGGRLVDCCPKNLLDGNTRNTRDIVLVDDEGKKKRTTLKKFYRDTFDKEYCIDTLENLPNEVWKEVEGTKGKYFISNKGRLKSYCRYSAIIVKPYKNQYGYLRADIRRNGKRETILIHRLVASAFVENDNPKEKDTVDHIDGNKNNNASDNLRWLSRSANVKAYFANL